MKKIFLLTVLLFQSLIVIGQSSDWTSFGTWGSGSCFPQIMTRIATGTNPNSKEKGVMVEFKNNYSQKVTFIFAVFNNASEAQQVFQQKGLLMGGRQSSISLGPGQTVTETRSIKNQGTNSAYIEIYALYFGEDYQHYQSCNNRTPCTFCEVNGQQVPACPNYSKTVESSSGQTPKNNQTTNSTSKQNDLTEYNRSKADLERQMAEKNQENANRRQQYTNTLNAGINAHNAGNYIEAKAQFNNALNYATTPEERVKARDYYNKSVKTSNDIQRINTVSTGLQETLTGIDAILKANKEKKRLKEEDEQKEKLYKERIAEEKRQETVKNANILEDKWKQAKDLANLETDNGYRQAIQLMIPESNRINGSALNTLGFWFDKINDYENAFKYFEKAANSKDATGMNNLGIYFEYGKGTEENISKALTWYSKSCNNGYHNACKTLEEKKSQFENEKLNKIYKNSSTLADIYFNLKQYQDALISYENSLTEKNQDSTQIETTCKKVANLYYYEEYNMKNYKNALDWYKTAFDYNNKDDSTSFIIGNMYEKGLGVEISYKNAIHYYMIAAKNENIDAIEKVGEIYQSGGYGIEKNFNEAKDWYLQAAEQGSRMAMRNLSNIYKEGDKFLKKNKSESKKWDIKAKEKFNFTVSN